MTKDRYSPPAVEVRDLVKPHGSLPWLLASALVVIVGQFLISSVAEPIVLAISAGTGLNVDVDSGLTVMLFIDIAISVLFLLAVMAAGARFTRSRVGSMLAAAAVALVAITFFWRWFANTYAYEWPLWYEAVLLLLPMVAAGVTFLAHRRRASDA
jgi:hypothetical protein